MFRSSREFKLWDYNVTHKQLLMRSPLTGANEDNLDIVFWGVEFLSVASVIDGITIRRATEGELKSFLPINLLSSEHQTPAYSIEAVKCNGFVLAAGCKVLRNQLGIFDSSLMYADRDRPIEEYGVVLASF